MRNVAQARGVASEFLSARDFVSDVPLVLMEVCEAFEAGWVFFYQSQSFAVDGVVEDALVGNAPIFVPRDAGSPQFVSYHRPLEESAEAYLRCGDPNGLPNPEVALLGWEPGAAVLSAVQALRDYTMLGLAASKEVLDQCLAGKPVSVKTASIASARELAQRLSQLHFRAWVTYSQTAPVSISDKRKQLPKT